MIADAGNHRIRKVTEVAAPSGNDVVWSAGLNHVGQLGDGTTANAPAPVKAKGLADGRDVAGGGFHTLSVSGEGTVWAWGWNYFGQLGTGTTTDEYKPARVVGVDGVVATAAGAFHSLALRADEPSGRGAGTAWASSAPAQPRTGGFQCRFRASRA